MTSLDSIVLIFCTNITWLSKEMKLCTWVTEVTISLHPESASAVDISPIIECVFFSASSVYNWVHTPSRWLSSSVERICDTLLSYDSELLDIPWRSESMNICHLSIVVTTERTCDTSDKDRGYLFFVQVHSYFRAMQKYLKI